MRPLSLAQLQVLSVIKSQPASWAIEIAEALAHKTVPVSLPKVYATLRILEDRGLVVGRTEPMSGPRSRGRPNIQYSTTERGLKLLKETLRDLDLRLQ